MTVLLSIFTPLLVLFAFFCGVGMAQGHFRLGGKRFADQARVLEKELGMVRRDLRESIDELYRTQRNVDYWRKDSQKWSKELKRYKDWVGRDLDARPEYVIEEVA